MTTGLSAWCLWSWRPMTDSCWATWRASKPLLDILQFPYWANRSAEDASVWDCTKSSIGSTNLGHAPVSCIKQSHPRHPPAEAHPTYCAHLHLSEDYQLPQDSNFKIQYSHHAHRPSTVGFTRGVFSCHWSSVSTLMTAPEENHLWNSWSLQITPLSLVWPGTIKFS